MVKIDLGCHIDGYIAVAAHTLIVGYVPNPTAPITGPKADLFHAAYAVRFKIIKYLLSITYSKQHRLICFTFLLGC